MSVKSKQILVRVGTQASRTAVSSNMVNVAVPAEGNQVAPTNEIETLDTDHGSPGVLYSEVVAKNAQAQAFRTHFYPDTIGRLISNLITRTSGAQGFLQIENWWPVDSLGSGTNRGERFRGCVLDSLSLDIAKTGIGSSIVAEFQAFINVVSEIAAAESFPALTFSPDGPYKTTGALIDWVPNIATGAFGAKNADVRRLNLRFSNNGTVDGFEDDSSSPVSDKTWTIHDPGEPSAEIRLTVSMSEEEYLTLQNEATLPTGALRLVLTHTGADSTTSTDTVDGADDTTQTLGVDDSAHFAVNDVILIQHPSGDFATAIVEAVRSGPDEIDIAGTLPRVDLDGGTGGPVTIRNMTAAFIFDAMKFQNRGPASRDGNRRVLEVSYIVTLAAGETEIVEALAYDHASGHA